MLLTEWTKKGVCLILAVFLTAGTQGCARGEGAQPPAAETTPAPELLFEDGFDGTELDAVRWEAYSDVERYGRMDVWDGELAFLNGNGHLVLEARWDEAEKRVRSGAVHTTDAFSGGLGYYEASIRFPKAHGIWGAFWSIAGNVTKVDGGSADGVEIDVIESIGSDENLCNHAIHWDGYGEDEQKDGKSFDFLNIYNGAFHTFGLWRTETEYIFYVDNEETWRTSAGGACPLDGNLMLTLEAADWAGAGTEQGIAALPAYMDVDFVRVWNTRPQPAGDAFVGMPEINVQMQIGNPLMTVNGAAKQIDDQGTAPVLMQNRTLMPVRALVEALGGQVYWDGAGQTVTLRCGGNVLRLKIDSTMAYRNGAAVQLDTAPILSDGRTMLPVRFIAESFGWKVTWDGEQQEIAIQRPALAADDPSRFTLQSQRLWVKTARNARQLGGYVMADGRRVKRNVLLRSAALAWLSQEDVNLLAEKYRLKYIVDFRGEEESAYDLNKEIPGAEHRQFPVYSADAFSRETQKKLGEIEAQFSDRTAQALAWAENGIISERYSRVLLTEAAQTAYAQFFRTLLSAKEGEAVLWHCSAGKDRAGIASALLLYALGAGEDLILRDFEISNEAYAKDIAKARAVAEEKGLDGETKEEFIVATEGVSARYLKLAFESVEREYGSLDSYLENRLGVTAEDRAALREKFLED